MSNRCDAIDAPPSMMWLGSAGRIAERDKRHFQVEDRPMKFTLHIPMDIIEPKGEFQSVSAVAEMATAIEKAGGSACFITDHPVPMADWLLANGHDALDPFTSLAFVAAATTKLKLHTNILVLPYRNPFVTAKAAATLDVLSGGRLILGVGVGYQKGEFDALGVDFAARGQLTDQALETIRLAWSGETVVKQGTTFNAPGNLPRPAPSPNPPIWIGGGSDSAVRRAVKHGDGWSPVWAAPGLSAINLKTALTSVEHLRDKIVMLRELLDEAGRAGEPFDINMGPRIQLKEHTRSEADRYLEAVAELKTIGVTWCGASMPHPSRAAFIENVQWFGEEIIARL
jgi:probable F420-dependent oxidoreductase